MEDNSYLKIKHLATGFYFKIAPNTVIEGSANGRREAPRLNTYSTPNYSGVVIQPGKEVHHANIDKWETVTHLFSKWLLWLKQEEEEPDLWGELETNARIFYFSQAAPDTMFDHEELALLKGQFKKLERQVAALNLPLHAVQELQAAFEEAALKAESFTKKDWKNHFVGLIINVAVTLALNPEQRHAFFALVKSAFSGLLLN
ncbi:hypothetical protein [Pontibacter cellulosilyticus]|uniref:Uncharacterized protein n=1 Tax=Pontibacter cellulosilyticus TaxID=1720253 RepID=A0A923NAU1_9BACT|nr:hypothetical protein [Pontibacter cellulosilyticus]MBC5994022.1 hypothetical protein [Pontibacter cellulosilyticus]